MNMHRSRGTVHSPQSTAHSAMDTRPHSRSLVCGFRPAPTRSPGPRGRAGLSRPQVGGQGCVVRAAWNSVCSFFCPPPCSRSSRSFCRALTALSYSSANSSSATTAVASSSAFFALSAPATQPCLSTLQPVNPPSAFQPCSLSTLSTPLSCTASQRL